MNIQSQLAAMMRQGTRTRIDSYSEPYNSVSISDARTTIALLCTNSTLRTRRDRLKRNLQCWVRYKNILIFLSHVLYFFHAVKHRNKLDNRLLHRSRPLESKKNNNKLLDTNNAATHAHAQIQLAVTGHLGGSGGARVNCLLNSGLSYDKKQITQLWNVFHLVFPSRCRATHPLYTKRRGVSSKQSSKALAFGAKYPLHLLSVWFSLKNLFWRWWVRNMQRVINFPDKLMELFNYSSEKVLWQNYT